MDLTTDLEDLVLSTSFDEIQDPSPPPEGPPTFMTLPQEIRCKIYEYATVFPETAELDEVNQELKRGIGAFEDAKTFIANCTRRPIKPFARLAAVNKQIRREIMHVGMSAYKARDLECEAMVKELRKMTREKALLEVYWLHVHQA